MKIHSSIWPEFESWLLFEEKLSAKAGTRDANRSRFRRVVGFFENNEFTRSNLTLFIYQLKNETPPKADSTCNNLIKMCKSLERYLHGLKLIDHMEMQDYKYFKESRIQEREILNYDEIDMLANLDYPYQKFREFLNYRNKTIILLLGAVGPRIGEVLELKFKDVMMDNGIPVVIFRDTKANNDRKVPIGQEVYDLIQGSPRKSEYVFTSCRNGGLRSGEIRTDLINRAKMVGIKKKMYNHLFRYSYIMNMTKLGIPDSDIMMVVGHEKHETFMRYKSLDITHMNNIVHLNPLLRAHQSREDRYKRISDRVEELIDKKIDDFQVRYIGKKMIIEIDEITN